MPPRLHDEALDTCRIFGAMPTREEVLQIDGHDVVITNPDKIFFPQAGHTKLDLVRYYLAVADGALRGAGGRPMALKRFVNGAAGEFFFQKRAPESRPDWIETVELSFPSGRTSVIDTWRSVSGAVDFNHRSTLEFPITVVFCASGAVSYASAVPALGAFQVNAGSFAHTAL